MDDFSLTIDSLIQLNTPFDSMFISIILHSVIGIMMMFSVGKFSSSIAGGVGGGSGSAMRGAVKAVRAFI